MKVSLTLCLFFTSALSEPIPILRKQAAPMAEAQMAAADGGPAGQRQDEVDVPTQPPVDLCALPSDLAGAITLLEDCETLSMVREPPEIIQYVGSSVKVRRQPFRLLRPR